MILKNGKRIDGASLDTTPIGTISPYLGVTAPPGYLLCQGQKVSKTRYKQLYNICKSLFGTETDTEFYLPDLRGKTITGYQSGDNTFGTLGGLIGNLTHTHSTGNHTLTVAEMPSHSHGVTNNYGDFGVANGSYGVISNTSGSGAKATVSINNTGGSGAHNHGNTGSTSTLQPSMNLNWIVKAEMIIENGSKVYNGLDSSSTVDALSAAQGKILNDKIASLSKVATSGSYNDLINKPTRVDYTSKMTSTYGTLNNNFNYCFLDNGMVHFNLSYKLTKALTAGQLYAIAILPTELIPKGNVICQAFSHDTCRMSAHYIRNVTGEIMIKPEKAVPIGNEINLAGDFYIK